MQLVVSIPDWGDVKEWLRARGPASLLAIAIELGVIAALLTLGRAQLEKKKAEDTLATFQVLPQAKVATKKKVPPAIKPARVHHESGGAAPKAPTIAPPQSPQPTPPTPLFIPLNSQEMASADIGKIHGGSNDAGAGASTGHDSGRAYGPGEGPGGDQLFYAEWEREPTRAEMVTYMPAGVSEGWGMVACKTVPGNRVDNCRSIGESPGSGLARMLRLAAWQFHVRPPRVNGKPQIGAWVRIKFDLIQGVEK